MDINSAVGRKEGISEEKLAALDQFEGSALFTPAEKAALRLAEAMCERSVNVPDSVFDELKQHFSDAQIVELTAMAALENYRARFNRALEVPSDGFCALPADHPAMRAAG